MMKKLHLLVLAMLFAVAGTNLVEAAKASNGSCKKHRHLKTTGGKCKTRCPKGRCKTKCTKIKTVCAWDKGWPKKPKAAPALAVAPAAQSLVYNLLTANTSISFLNAQGGVISTASVVSGASTPVPANTASMTAGPNTDDTVTEGTVSLPGALPVGAQYNITSDGEGALILIKQAA